MEVNLHAYGTKTVGGDWLMGGGSGYQVHPNVLWLVEHFLDQEYSFNGKVTGPLGSRLVAQPPQDQAAGWAR